MSTTQSRCSWLVGAVLAAYTPASAADSIAWVGSVDEALARAKREGRPVFIAVNMDNERANDHMVNVVYPEPAIRELAAATVPLFVSRYDHGSGDSPCPRAGTVTCAEHMAAEKEVRRRFLKEGPGGAIVAPEHVLLRPDGSVLLSVPYLVQAHELEWCLARAIGDVDKEFRWKASSQARAPKLLVLGAVSAPTEGLESQEMPTAEQVEELIDALKRAAKPWHSRDTIRRLSLSPDKKAIAYIEDLLEMSSSRGQRLIEELLHEIGRSSPADYYKVLIPYLADKRPSVRAEAVVALEQLREPRALDALLKYWKKEREGAVRRELIRAVAACGGDDKKAVAAVTKGLADKRDEDVRVGAVLAAADLLDRDLVNGIIRDGLGSDVGRVRAAAACVIALRRETDLVPLLHEVRGGEDDEATRDALAVTARVLDGEATAAELARVIGEVSASGIARDRM